MSLVASSWLEPTRMAHVTPSSPSGLEQWFWPSPARTPWPKTQYVGISGNQVPHLRYVLNPFFFRRRTLFCLLTRPSFNCDHAIFCGSANFQGPGICCDRFALPHCSSLLQGWVWLETNFAFLKVIFYLVYTPKEGSQKLYCPPCFFCVHNYPGYEDFVQESKKYLQMGLWHYGHIAYCISQILGHHYTHDVVHILGSFGGYLIHPRFALSGYPKGSFRRRDHWHMLIFLEGIWRPFLLVLLRPPQKNSAFQAEG